MLIIFTLKTSISVIFGLGKGKKIQNLTFATQSGAAPVM